MEWVSSLEESFGPALAILIGGMALIIVTLWRTVKSLLSLLRDQSEKSHQASLRFAEALSEFRRQLDLLLQEFRRK